MSKVKEKQRMFIREEHKANFFTVDASGRELTLGDYIRLREESSRMHKQEIIGTPATQRNPVVNRDPQPAFTKSQIEKLVDQYLKSMGPDVVLEIEGESLSAAQLKEAVRANTHVGREFVLMILADRSHVESLINEENYDTD